MPLRPKRLWKGMLLWRWRWNCKWSCLNLTKCRGPCLCRPPWTSSPALVGLLLRLGWAPWYYTPGVAGKHKKHIETPPKACSVTDVIHQILLAVILMDWLFDWLFTPRQTVRLPWLYRLQACQVCKKEMAGVEGCKETNPLRHFGLMRLSSYIKLPKRSSLSLSRFLHHCEHLRHHDQHRRRRHRHWSIMIQDAVSIYLTYLRNSTYLCVFRPICGIPLVHSNVGSKLQERILKWTAASTVSWLGMTSRCLVALNARSNK